MSTIVGGRISGSHSDTFSKERACSTKTDFSLPDLSIRYDGLRIAKVLSLASSLLLKDIVKIGVLLFFGRVVFKTDTIILSYSILLSKISLYASVGFTSRIEICSGE